MRALIATAVVILIALLVAIGTGAFNQGTASTKDAEFDDGHIDIELIGGKGPGFDVETGSEAPGERERQAEAQQPEGQAPANGMPASDQSAGAETIEDSGPRNSQPSQSEATSVPAQP